MQLKTVTPCGHRVLVKPVEIETVSKGGIIIESGKDAKRKQHAQILATVVAIGDNAWKDFGGKPWCSVNDTVLISKFAGYELMINDQMHRLINDEDVCGIVEETV